jgi:hypothetical protein
VVFFSTYAGAALEAHKKNLITRSQLMEVVAAAQKELDEIHFLGTEATAMKANRQLELSRDIGAINNHCRGDT